MTQKLKEWTRAQILRKNANRAGFPFLKLEKTACPFLKTSVKCRRSAAVMAAKKYMR